MNYTEKFNNLKGLNKIFTNFADPKKKTFFDFNY
jgi:hypothetical protein